VEGTVVLTKARLDQLLEAEITSQALRETRPMTLQSILECQHNVTELASLLHDELPVRYAQRIMMLESLPDWHKQRALVEVRQMYVASFKELRVIDTQDHQAFQVGLRKIKKRHSHTNLLVGGFKSYAQADDMGEHEINEWLDRFFMLRVSTNMLISHFLEMTGGEVQQPEFGDEKCNPYQSSINEECDPAAIARHAADVVGKLSMQWYDCAPEIEVTDAGAKPFPFVPRYLFYILTELLKNSVRASVEQQTVSTPDGQAHISASSLPPVRVLVSGSEALLSARISDQGGGIPVDRLNHVWSYLYTTAEPIDRPMTRESLDAPTDLRMLEMGMLHSLHSLADGDDDHTMLMRSPLAGLGCGLPLSRLYARYLGGSLRLQTLPCFGTDVFVELNRLGTSNEHLLEL